MKPMLMYATRTKDAKIRYKFVYCHSVRIYSLPVQVPSPYPNRAEIRECMRRIRSSVTVTRPETPSLSCLCLRPSSASLASRPSEYMYT